MNNFLYDIPTKVYFGKDQLGKLAPTIKEFGDKVLLVYGGGSIKKNGLYDQVTKKMKENGIAWVELAGVDPNPRLASVKEGVALCREHGLEVILAVGGGSSIDCAKVISAAVSYPGDPWELVLDPQKMISALPLISVLTLSATGSEMNAGAVISNPETNDKIGVNNPIMAPRYSFLDPTATYSVPQSQTAAGTADIISHIFEAYFQQELGNKVADRMAEALLTTCITYGPIAMKDPENYEARANLMWAGSLAINGLISYGKEGGWTVHPIEHELSAYYDITHGVGLAILTPHWMKMVLGEDTVGRFVDYGVNVWGIDPNLAPMEIAQLAIDHTDTFFRSLNIPMTLKEVGIGEEHLEIMSEKSAKRLGKSYVPLDKAQVLALLKAAL